MDSILTLSLLTGFTGQTIFFCRRQIVSHRFLQESDEGNKKILKILLILST